ncbi:MAG: hypothetical protein AYK19_19690 [Theionarchaea archaeon DG-70-1]|nr:MAG: hypothetical protein AYK19_19690 [Theionarchaea archaeon DG-70-1]
MVKRYPVLKEDIYFAKIHTDSGLQVRIRNTTTEKDFKPTPDTVALLTLCTGTNTVDEIIAILSEQSGEPADTLVEDVTAIVKVLQEKGILTIATSPLKRSILPAKEIKGKYLTESTQIEITNRCNLSCVHCVNNSGEPCPDELTTGEILSLIDTLSSMGVQRIIFTGGEPLLHPDLFQILEHARKAPMIVDIFTNGTLLTEENVKKFKKLGIRQFAVSIDCINESIHDAFRGQKGALRRTLHGIKLLKEAEFPVRISISIAQLNKNDIIDTIMYLEEHDLKPYQMAEVNFSGRGLEGVAVSPEEYYQVMVEQLTYRKEFSNEIKAPVLKPEGGCGIAQSEICIKSDGTILPCHACLRDMGVGNVRDVDLAEFWDNNETLEMFRGMRAENDTACRDCRYLAFCEGCIANAFTLERKIRSYDPYACARQKAYDTVFAAEEMAEEYSEDINFREEDNKTSLFGGEGGGSGSGGAPG